MNYKLNYDNIGKILKYIKSKKSLGKTFIYIGVDVGKNILDVGFTINNSNIQLYLGSVENTVKGFKKIEKFVKDLIINGINEQNIFFATENTGTYGHDLTNFFEDRLPNVYILNSNLTYSARQFYAKNNFKNDEIDAIIIATTLRDIDNKGNLESENNPFKKNQGIAFIRRSFGKQKDILRLLFRNLASLRTEKSKLMTMINLYKENLFPEIRDIFKIKSRATCQNILIENFSRNEILQMNKGEFLEKYKSLSTKGQQNKIILQKIIEFYDKVIERGYKVSHSKLDEILGKDSDLFVLDNIKYKKQHYDLITQEIEIINEKINNQLTILKGNGYFIPSFKGINDNEIGIFLGELGNGIYTMTSKELMGFIGWHPNNYTSGGGHIVKASKFSNKKSIIKKFVYIWMYGFNMHNPSFRLYKKLLTSLYGINNESDSIIKLKNKRKIEAKSGQKLLEIIHSCYKYSCTFDENKFLKSTILPLIFNMKSKGISTQTIKNEILGIYKTIPGILIDILN